VRELNAGRVTCLVRIASTPTLLQGIFFYQKTPMEELQLEMYKTKNAIRQVFIDTGITPFEHGRWNQHSRQRFTDHRKTSAANHILSNVLKLQCVSVHPWTR
jgi:hypothetical protein